MAVPFDTAEKLSNFFLLIQKHEVFEITSVSSRPAKCENVIHYYVLQLRAHRMHY